MAYKETPKNNFENARVQFANGIINKSEAINTPKNKKFKYEVRSPGVVHTTARKNNVGNGLNELNAKHELNPFRKLRERSESISSSSTQSRSSSIQAELDRMMVKNINAFEQNPNVQPKSKATIDDMLFGGVNDSTPCLTPQKNEETKVEKQVHSETPKQAAKSPAKKAYNALDYNPIYQGKTRFSPDRLKPKHPSKQIEQSDFTKSDKRDPNLVRCGNTYSGETFEPKMERNHGFQVDLSVKHVKGDIATCPATRGNGKKGVDKPDASSKQKPASEFSQVSVKELVKRFRG
jgi:hypothetical protein